MPSRTRIVFVDPIDSLNAGRRMAHMGSEALKKLLTLYRNHRGRYATVPGGSPVERARWAWNQLLKEERVGAGLYIIRERRHQPWSSSSARPENLGFYQYSPKWARAKMEVLSQPSDGALWTYTTVFTTGLTAGQIQAPSLTDQPQAKKPKTKTPFNPNYTDDSPWSAKSRKKLLAEPEYSEETSKPASAETSGPGHPRPDKPKKRLQIGVWV